MSGSSRKVEAQTRLQIGGRRRGIVVPRGSLASVCWCEAEYVAVPVDDVFEGRTKTCGRPACKAIAAAAITVASARAH